MSIFQVKISAVKFSLYQTRGLSARTLSVVWGHHEPEAGDHSSHDIIIQPPELAPHPPSPVPASLTTQLLSDHQILWPRYNTESWASLILALLMHFALWWINLLWKSEVLTLKLFQVSCCFESTELFHWLELVSGAIMYSPWGKNYSLHSVSLCKVHPSLQCH